MSIKDLVPRFGRESAPARREDVRPPLVKVENA